jgi:hypothetical protein
MRFYFDLLDGEDVLRDREGMELAGVAAVSKIAALTLVDMAKGMAKTMAADSEQQRSEVSHQMAIHVRDSDGHVMQVRLSFSLDVQTPQ